MSPVTASQFPDMYRDLGIDIGNLGCIMVNTDPLQVSDIIAPEDLYAPEDSNHDMGAVSETSPHLTLLYGLMSDGHAMQKHVDTVLADWSLDSVEVGSVDYFDIVDGETGIEYYCLIAKLVVTPELLEGNARLRLLPHLETFPLEYIPHITLAYINKVDDAKLNEYLKALNTRFALETIGTTSLNYGD